VSTKNVSFVSTDVTIINVTPKVDTINGLPRVLLDEVIEILKQFWHKQPDWGDAAVEFNYAEKIIHAVQSWEAK
jgi:hypothetical protein